VGPDKVAGVFHVDRRGSARHVAALAVTFPWQKRDAYGETLDISETGLRLRADAQLSVGLRLVLYLSMGSGLPMERIEVEVARAKAVAGQPGIFECGCRFIVLPPGTREKLHALLAQVAKAARAEEVDEADIIELPTGRSEDFSDPHALDAALASDTEKRGKNKQVAEQLLKIARGLMEQGEFDTAIKTLEQGAQRVPDSADIIEELAQLLFQRGRVSESAALFDKALRIRQEQG
jgi:tetratricopeptide (TPR) repeat protein